MSVIRSNSRSGNWQRWSSSSPAPPRGSSPSRSPRMIRRFENRTSHAPARCLGGSRKSLCATALPVRSNISVAWSAVTAWRLERRWRPGARLEASPNLLSLAKERFAVRDYHGAALLLTSVTEEGPAFADAFNLLGLSLAMVDRADDAVAAFDQALRVNPRYVEAYLNRAVVLNHLGREDEARVSMPRAPSSSRSRSTGAPSSCGLNSTTSGSRSVARWSNTEDTGRLSPCSMKSSEYDLHGWTPCYSEGWPLIFRAILMQRARSGMTPPCATRRSRGWRSIEACSSGAARK